jgi:hypothetical protein
MKKNKKDRRRSEAHEERVARNSNEEKEKRRSQNKEIRKVQKPT